MRPWILSRRIAVSCGVANLPVVLQAYFSREAVQDVVELTESALEAGRAQLVRIMAIVHARVDERLIHGQVAMVWTNTVGASRIVVVNDEAVKSEMIIAGLKMAKPTGVKLSILSVKRAGEKIDFTAWSCSTAPGMPLVQMAAM